MHCIAQSLQIDSIDRELISRVKSFPLKPTR